MENKYYEPDVEDFYVGMIYETEQDELRGIWEENTINTLRELEELCKYNSKYIGKYSNIRVKYLSKEDIESLGFKQHEKLKYQYYKDHFMFVELHRDNQYSIEDLTDSQCIFYGMIKNKSELKKLLIQLEIINE